jgi:hypothetical protein
MKLECRSQGQSTFNPGPRFSIQKIVMLNLFQHDEEIEINAGKLSKKTNVDRS